MKKLLFRFILLIILIILIIGGYLYISGKSLYNKKINQIGIEDKVNEIRNSEHYTTLDEVPKEYINAIIAVEDHRFYDHGPIDYIALLRAIIRNFKAKDLIEGGSTITQQVAKNLYFITDGDGADRKIAELIVAHKLEEKYSKNEILELYINIIYFGDGYYCVYDAAKGYFGKEPSEMNLYECTLLAGIPNAPSVYSPTVNPELAKKRQQKVIDEMVEHEYITQQQADEIIK